MVLAMFIVLGTFLDGFVAPDIPIRSIFRGIIPFWLAMLALLVLLALLPGLVTFLPRAMLG